MCSTQLYNDPIKTITSLNSDHCDVIQRIEQHIQLNKKFQFICGAAVTPTPPPPSAKQPAIIVCSDKTK